MDLYNYNDENGYSLVGAEWYLPSLIENLKKHADPCYTYYRGKRIDSSMTDDEIYAITYGSKEAYDKKYPDGYGNESLAIAKKELLYSFISVAQPDVAEDHIKVIREKGDCVLEYDVGEFVLALANGAPCKDIIVLINRGYSSGNSFAWMLSHVARSSLRGDELLEYYKTIDPVGYNVYVPDSQKKEIDSNSKKL